MSNSPDSQNQTESTATQPRWVTLLKRTSFTVGGILLVGTTAGIAYGIYFVNNELAPFVSTQLTKLVQRPVDVGPVERFSLTGLTLGTTEVPPTPTDPDRATIPTIEVNFDLWQLIRTRTLSLDITAIDPNIYLEQNSDGAWVDTQLATDEDSEPGPISIELDTIDFINGELVLVANPQLLAQRLGRETLLPPNPVTIQDLDGSAEFLDNQTRVAFDVSGDSTPNGTLDISGEVAFETLDTQLQIRGQNLYAPDILTLIPNLPIRAFDGSLNANLGITLQEAEVLQWQGTAGFNSLNAQLAGLPKKLYNARGRLRFSGLTVGLEDARALYGQIPGTAAGVIDTAGEGEYNLNIDIQPVKAENFIETLDLPAPVPITGVLAGEMNVSGPLQAPVVFASISNRETAQVDKIEFETVRASVAIDVGEEQVRLTEFFAEPVVGGEISGGGTVPLQPTEALDLTFQATSIPGNAIADNYLEDPLPLAIGPVFATARITGSPDEATTLVEWQALQGTYPARGEIIAVGETILIPNTRIQVAGGVIAANGTLRDERWRATVTAQGLRADRLALPAQPPPIEAEGILDARFSASGTLDFSVETLEAMGRATLTTTDGGNLSANARLNNAQLQATVRGDEIALANLVPTSAAPVALPEVEANLTADIDSLEPDRLRATATARVRVPGAVAIATGRLNRGQFSLTATTEGVPLDPWLTEPLPVPVRIADARVTLSGNLDALQPEALNATSQIQLNVAGNPLNARVQLRRGQLVGSVTANTVPLDPFVPADFPVPVQLARGRVNFAGDIAQLDPRQMFATTNLQLRVADAPVGVEGRLVNGQFQAVVNANGVPLDPLLAADLPVQVGLVRGEARLSGNIDSLEPEGINAIAQLQFSVADAAIRANATVRRGNLDATLSANSLQLDRFAPDLLPTPVRVDRSRVNLEGDLASLSLATLNASTQLRLTLANGRAFADGSLRNGNFQASVRASEVLVNALTRRALPLRTEIDSGNVTVSGTLAALDPATFDPDNLNATARLDLNVADTAARANASLRRGNFQATLSTEEAIANRFAPDLPAPVEIGRSRVTVRGNIDALDIFGVDATALVQLQVADGRVRGRGTLEDGRLAAVVNAADLQLAQFLPDLNAPLELERAAITLDSTLDNVLNFQPSAINADTELVLQSGEGRLFAQGNLRNGALQARGTVADIGVNRFAQLPFPVELLQGQFAVSGTVPNLDPRGLNAEVELGLAVANADAVASARLNNGEFVATVTTQEVRESDFGENLPSTLEIGEARVTVTGNVREFEPGAIDARLLGQLQLAGGSVSARGAVSEGNLRAFVDAREIQVNQFAPDLPVPVQVATGEATVRGNLSELELSTLDATTRVELLVDSSSVFGSGSLDDGAFQATLLADELTVISQRENPLRVSGARVNLAGSLTSANIEDIYAEADVQLGLAGGEIRGDGTLNNGDLRAFVYASGLDGNQLAADLPVQVELADAEAVVAGDIANLSPQGLDARGEARLQVAGAPVTTDFGWNDGAWQATVRTSNLPLNPLVPALSEPLALSEGTVRVSGTAESFALAEVRAGGEARLILADPDPESALSPFASSISPLRTAFRWNGDNLQVTQLDAPGLNASGTVFVDVRGEQAPQVRGFNFDVALDEFNLAGLPLPVENLPQVAAREGDEVPPPPYLAGAVSFAGQVRGTATPDPDSPLPFAVTATGEMRLADLQVATLDFEPLISGPVRVNTAQGVEIDLRGDMDAIAVTLDDRFFPESFLLRRGDTLARGTVENQVLRFVVEEFPLGIANLAFDLPPGPVGGAIYSSGEYDLARNAGRANIAVAGPRVGYIDAERFVAEVAYDEGLVVVDEALLRLGESEYRLAARAVLAENPSFEGQIEVVEGRVQDVLQALQLFTVEDAQRGLTPPDYAGSEQLDLISVGLPGERLLTQLRRLSEIATLVQQQAAIARQPGVPEIIKVRGEFDGEITFAGTAQTGVEANFDIVSDGLQWFTQRPYQAVVGDRVVLREGRVVDIEEAIVRGSFANGVVTLLPARIRTEESLISFSGAIGGENQSGQLRVENLAVDLIRNFVELPDNFDVEGLVNLRATLAGSVENPQSRGEVWLDNGTVNGEEIPGLRGAFSYDRSRLNFSSIAPEDLRVSASVPLPPTPGNDEFSLSVDIEDDGLSLIDVATGQQVEWVEGSATVEFQAQGRLDPEAGVIEDLVATGSAAIANATIDAQALPEPLTNVTGTAQFERDRIVVEGIRGEFREGEVLAQGVLPIDTPTSQVENPLTVRLDELRLNLKGLYEGGVDGQIAITGTALEPDLGGEILLSDGTVLLPSDPSGQAAANGAPGAGDEEQFGVEYDGLRVVLGEDLKISSPPLLQFVASGDLTINGFIDDPRPQGTIRLDRGLVNLFTTQFRLARDAENVAVFTGTLNPYLDVRLVANVPEVRNTNLVSVASQSEVNDPIETTIGDGETIRVIASVEGRASQLEQNLELSSSPARSEQEIVALIGGGFVNTFGQGNTTLALANIAGNTLLLDVQNSIANALGLSEFRLGPAIVDRGSFEQLALEVKAGVDITSNFSVSVERVLVDERPTDFSVRYRINDEVILRGATDFDDNHRALFEYQLRF
ncbi:translocation/assembly module TamB domain-containing protein [Phormidium sp. CCY1219]|uniref:translocation/assembly module TamB domain-containing protein n=1 Tax=Phormidium sp. CCY1219 TaxID=2886104 RepID=UPI002D1E9CAB|nr:translocation/assembly module TamB domain-containing protein [Phormidium sp. CCY1219]MEB3830179.1 translocation/assembly module TamB domain-containing protein [Phormidium sp. CCY1219]